MGFAVTYGFFSGCFLSLTSPVAARLYGAGRLAGLSGLLFMFIAPGQLVGATISSAIYNSTKSWHIVTAYSGGVQVVGAICLLYGAALLFTRPTRRLSYFVSEARLKREPRIMAIL
jgi:hypothetical protein